MVNRDEIWVEKPEHLVDVVFLSHVLEKDVRVLVDVVLVSVLIQTVDKLVNRESYQIKKLVPIHKLNPREVSFFVYLGFVLELKSAKIYYFLKSEIIMI